MNYKILDLIDLELLEKNMINFYHITNIPCYILDSKGELLSPIELTRSYTNYCSQILMNFSIISNQILKTIDTINEKEYYIHKGSNGLYHAFIPIKLDNQVLCYLCLSNFIFEESNTPFLKSQIKEYNNDKKKSLDYILDIKVLDESKFNNIMNFLITSCKQFEHSIKKQKEYFKKEYNQLIDAIVEKNEQLKNAKECDKVKAEFFSNICHELKTPISVIYSALQVINNNSSDNFSSDFLDKEKKDKYLHIMRQNCLRLIRLVNNILDISKLEAGYLKLNFQNCNIIELVENITLSIVDYIENTGIEIVFDTNKEEQIIACDPESIERIILNILSNAVKFTDKGGKILVNITSNSDTVSISIKDNGIGIPYDNQNNIFDRFVQASKCITSELKGSGIGLSLVKALVDAHHGEVLLNSEVNIGTEFIINLPIRQISNIPISKNNHSNNNNSHIEKVHIEFSDIYI
ncbi:sensor histidine kinase [Clostridium sp. DL1XJH146]